MTTKSLQTIYEEARDRAFALADRNGIEKPQLAESIPSGLKTAYQKLSKAGKKPRIVISVSLSREQWNAELKKHLQTKRGLWVSVEFDGLDLTEPWSIAVLPATEYPPKVNVTYEEAKPTNNLTTQMYLSLQLSLLEDGLDPVDRPSWTFVEVPGYTRLGAPGGGWDPDAGQVRLFWLSVDLQRDRLGSRVSVWSQPLIFDASPSLETFPLPSSNDLVVTELTFNGKTYRLVEDE